MLSFYSLLGPHALSRCPDQIKSAIYVKGDELSGLFYKQRYLVGCTGRIRGTRRRRPRRTTGQRRILIGRRHSELSHRAAPYSYISSFSSTLIRKKRLPHESFFCTLIYLKKLKTRRRLYLS